MTKKLILTALVLLCGAFSALAQQRVLFNADYALQDIRADIGIMTPIEDNEADAAPFLELTYTRKFWRQLAWKAGFQAQQEPLGYQYFVGVPLGLAFKTGTVSFEDSVAYALEESVFDTVRDGLSGRTDRIDDDILTNLLFILFRRSEFYAGITPGWYGGGPFSLTADAGLVLSIPIWRLSLNVTPTYHYSFTGNSASTRHFMSISAGIGLLF